MSPRRIVEFGPVRSPSAGTNAELSIPSTARAAADFLVQPGAAAALGRQSSFIHRTEIEYPEPLTGARNEFNAVDRARDFKPLERCVIESRFAVVLRVHAVS
jgi:hypothetical protein